MFTNINKKYSFKRVYYRHQCVNNNLCNSINTLIIIIVNLNENNTMYLV